MTASVETSTQFTLDRDALLAWYRRNRERSRFLFDLVKPESYYRRPIPLRNPVAFYEGHLPAFSVNTLIKGALGEPGVDERYEVLFERGIDPESEDEAEAKQASRWPSRAEILAYGADADRRIERALREGEIVRDDDPRRIRANAAFTILEHEEIHHETMLYMWHMLPHDQKRTPPGLAPPVVSPRSPHEPRTARIPPGIATLGAGRDEIAFGWDNEFPSHQEEVPAFEIDVFDVTNGEFMEFVRAGAYEQDDLWSETGRQWIRESGVRHPNFWTEQDGRWYWRGMFALIPLPDAWPVFVTHAEAEAYARWKGRRLMTEAEFHRAAYGTPEGNERSFPWGEQPPDHSRGNFGFQSWEPVPVGSYEKGVSAWGVHDLLGNGWEWTSSLFRGFEGFEPMASYPLYSEEFFDGQHYVIKGGSQATAFPLLRRSLRNWFRPAYPYVYATFRTAR